MTHALFYLLFFVLALPSSPTVVGASPTPLKPSLYGRVLILTGEKGTAPMTDARLQLFALAPGLRGFALVSTAPLIEGRTDSRGFYSFYNLAPATYKLQVVGKQGIGGGTIVRVSFVGTSVPTMTIDWKDPCRNLYGTGYAVDYIRTKVNVPWRANAGDWLEIAAKSGWRTNRTGSPDRAPAIAVFPVTHAVPFGHVAWVDSVDTAHRTFVVSQWNEPGPVESGQQCWKTANFGKLTSKEWRFGDPAISGLIYYPGQ
jgi:hypothetical protein